MAVYGSYILTEGLFDKIKAKKEEKQRKKEELRKQQEYEEAKEVCQETAKWLKQPHTLGDGYDSDILFVVGKIMDIQQFSKFLQKNKSKFKIITPNNLTDSSTMIKKINNQLGSKFGSLLENDDYEIAFNLSTFEVYEMNLYNDQINKYNITRANNINGLEVSVLKKADKELGTGLFK